jgi:hypothetical protein
VLTESPNRPQPCPHFPPGLQWKPMKVKRLLLCLRFLNQKLGRSVNWPMVKGGGFFASPANKNGGGGRIMLPRGRKWRLQRKAGVKDRGGPFEYPIAVLPLNPFCGQFFLMCLQIRELLDSPEVCGVQVFASRETVV